LSTIAISPKRVSKIAAPETCVHDFAIVYMRSGVGRKTIAPTLITCCNHPVFSCLSRTKRNLKLLLD
jgi:hypothetical protein